MAIRNELKTLSPQCKKEENPVVVMHAGPGPNHGADNYVVN